MAYVIASLILIFLSEEGVYCHTAFSSDLSRQFSTELSSIFSRPKKPSFQLSDLVPGSNKDQNLGNVLAESSLKFPEATLNGTYKRQQIADSVESDEIVSGSSVKDKAYSIYLKFQSKAHATWKNGTQEHFDFLTQIRVTCDVKSNGQKPKCGPSMEDSCSFVVLDRGLTAHEETVSRLYCNNKELIGRNVAKEVAKFVQKNFSSFA